VLLEQPEIHLHPAVQTGLADILIEVAKVRGVQVVVESHSEHLLLRLQRRIAEQGLPRGRVPLAAGDCALYFCDTEGGRSVVDQLDLDLYGNITNWPADFFGNSLEEATAMTMAAASREAEAGLP
jgi:predicted ATPase